MAPKKTFAQTRQSHKRSSTEDEHNDAVQEQTCHGPHRIFQIQETIEMIAEQLWAISWTRSGTVLLVKRPLADFRLVNRSFAVAGAQVLFREVVIAGPEDRWNYQGAEPNAKWYGGIIFSMGHLDRFSLTLQARHVRTIVFQYWPWEENAQKFFVDRMPVDAKGDPVRLEGRQYNQHISRTFAKVLRRFTRARDVKITAHVESFQVLLYFLSRARLASGSLDLHLLDKAFHEDVPGMIQITNPEPHTSRSHRTGTERLTGYLTGLRALKLETFREGGHVTLANLLRSCQSLARLEMSQWYHCQRHDECPDPPLVSLRSLRVLKLDRLRISATALGKVFDNCKNTLHAINLTDVHLTSGYWHEVLAKAAQLPELRNFRGWALLYCRWDTRVPGWNGFGKFEYADWFGKYRLYHDYPEVFGPMRTLNPKDRWAWTELRSEKGSKAIKAWSSKTRAEAFSGLVPRPSGGIPCAGSRKSLFEMGDALWRCGKTTKLRYDTRLETWVHNAGERMEDVWLCHWHRNSAEKETLQEWPWRSELGP